MEKINIELVAGDIRKSISVDKHTRLEFLTEFALPDSKRKYIAALVDGKLRELRYQLEGNSVVEFVGMETVIGFDIYKRGLTLLMLKSFKDVLGERNDYYIDVMYSLGKGFFCRIVSENVKCTEKLISEVKEKMFSLVNEDIPINKNSVSTDEARIKFGLAGLKDKEKLLKYRRVSKINLYHLGDYSDYFYGYMPASTGYLRYFDLVTYDDGFVLVVPDNKHPEQKIEYTAPEKLYKVLRKGEDWGDMMDVECVGDINDVVTNGDINDLMLVQEALMEKEIAEIACRIIDENKRVVLIAGPSSSGKTTFSHRLSIQLRAHGMHPHPIALDNFFKDRDETPRDEDGNFDFECLEAVDLELFNSAYLGILKCSNDICKVCVTVVCECCSYFKNIANIAFLYV